MSTSTVWRMSLTFLENTVVCKDCEYPYRKGSTADLGAMPFPSGIGGGRANGAALSSSQNFEVITADKAIDESNVGNRMLQNMGWQGLVPPISPWESNV